jgi:hypothetical protein
LLVVDIDGEGAGVECKLVNASGCAWPYETATVLTGKGGLRVHYYLRVPDGVVLGKHDSDALLECGHAV